MPKGNLLDYLEADLKNAEREVEEEFGKGKKALKEKEDTKVSKPKKAKKKPSKIKQHKLQMSPTELYENIQAHKKEMASKSNQGKKSIFIFEEYHQKLLPVKMSNKINMTDAFNYFIGYFLETDAYKEFVQKLKNEEIR